MFSAAAENASKPWRLSSSVVRALPARSSVFAPLLRPRGAPLLLRFLLSLLLRFLLHVVSCSTAPWLRR